MGEKEENKTERKRVADSEEKFIGDGKKNKRKCRKKYCCARNCSFFFSHLLLSRGSF